MLADFHQLDAHHPVRYAPALKTINILKYLYKI
jgi:hypothetical protein